MEIKTYKTDAVKILSGYFAGYRGNFYGPFDTIEEARKELINRYLKDSRSDFYFGVINEGQAYVKNKHLCYGTTLRVEEHINIRDEIAKKLPYPKGTVSVIEDRPGI